MRSATEREREREREVKLLLISDCCTYVNCADENAPKTHPAVVPATFDTRLVEVVYLRISELLPSSEMSKSELLKVMPHGAQKVELAAAEFVDPQTPVVPMNTDVAAEDMGSNRMTLFPVSTTYTRPAPSSSNI